ncbi:MAG: FkbM family methyltransferase [Cryobacterium sp.]|nr:FkbM family methyltransferase [Cryobacterium sp.]
MRRPATATIRAHRHDLLISFRYPAQLIPTLVVFGDLLEPELGLLPDELGPGAVALDVGASIGTWTMVAASTGATVHACEPDPDNLDLLRLNLDRNGSGGKVVIHHVAVGRHSGRVRLQQNARRYLNQVREVHDNEGIPLVSLTEFVEDLDVREVDVLKVNTAGHEADVLVGGLQLFRAGRIRLAMFLDGIDVRQELRRAMDNGDLEAYKMAIYDGDRGQLVDMPTVDDLVQPRPSPLNHYILLHRGVTGDPRSTIG